MRKIILCLSIFMMSLGVIGTSAGERGRNSFESNGTPQRSSNASRSSGASSFSRPGGSSTTSSASSSRRPGSSFGTATTPTTSSRPGGSASRPSTAGSSTSTTTPRPGSSTTQRPGTPSSTTTPRPGSTPSSTQRPGTSPTGPTTASPRPGNPNNRPGSSVNGPGNQNNRPGGGLGNVNNRPGTPPPGGNKPGNPGVNRPGTPPPGGAGYRPGNPGGYRPNTPPPGGYRPNTPAPRPPQTYRPTYSYRPPRPHTPPSYRYFRPTPPISWRPPARPLNFGTILGITLGSIISNSVNALLTAGYHVAGYTSNEVYLNNVNYYNVSWPNATMYYDNGYLTGSLFASSSLSYDMTRYNYVYSELTSRYGMPISTQNLTGGGMSCTWWGANNSYLTLSFYPEDVYGYGTRYFTTLSVGN